MCVWRLAGIQTSLPATVRTASISVSTAKRLNTTARAPLRSAATASAGISLAVSTMTGTRADSDSMSPITLRSIWRSSSSRSQGVSVRTAARSPT